MQSTKPRYLFIALFCISLMTYKASAESNTSVAPLLKPSLWQLRVCKSPVKLPSWLPPMGKSTFVSVGGGNYKDGYEVSLGLTPDASNADTGFFLDGGKGKAHPTKHKVSLASGVIGYISTANFAAIQWNEGIYCYMIGIPNSGKKELDSDLLRMANSMVTVSESTMNAAPKSEKDGLVAAYNLEMDTQTSSNRSEIGLKYKEALRLAGNKQYSKAADTLAYVIKNWADCSEMPPLAEIQMAYARVLTQLGQKDKAQEIKTKYSPELSKLEKHYFDCVDALDQKVALTKGGAGELDTATRQSHITDGLTYHGTIRGYLSEAEHKLADIYVAEGQDAKAEDLYRDAFHDEACGGSRNTYEARCILDDYKTLLSLMGRSAADAEKLRKPETPHHQPVVLELKPGSLKTNGADKLVIVLEDEYGAPSGPFCWFTRKASLQGMKAGKAIWIKPIKLRERVNMDTASVDVSKNTFTIWFGAAQTSKRCCEEVYSWDGNNVVFESIAH